MKYTYEEKPLPLPRGGTLEYYECSKCGQLRPETEYYRRANGSRYGLCKDCQRKSTARVYAERKGRIVERLETGAGAEQMVVEQLMRRGVPAVRHGTDYAGDVVAWGCVSVEVKSSKFYAPPSGARGGVYKWSFQPEQAGGAHYAPVVALVTLEPLVRFFVFDHRHPLFWWAKDGSRANVKAGTHKTGVQWQPSSMGKHGWVRGETFATDAIMLQHEDCWQWVEHYRLEYSAKLISGWRP